jgi:esterase/lipase superfamily enzyme
MLRCSDRVSVALCLGLALFALPSAAQEEGQYPIVAKVVKNCPNTSSMIESWKAAPPDKMASLIEAWRAAPRRLPKEFHDRIESEGEWGVWDVAVKRWSDPGDKPAESDGGKGKSFDYVGGRVLAEFFETTVIHGSGREELQGFSVTGYDSTANRYVSVWTGHVNSFDNMDPNQPSEVSELGCWILYSLTDETSDLIFLGEFATRRMGPKRQTLELFEMRAGDKIKTMEISHSREVIVTTPDLDRPRVLRSSIPEVSLINKTLRSAIVYYGTNRDRTGNSEPNGFYGSDALEGRLELGKFKVTFPESHKKGKVERPFIVFEIVLRGNQEDPTEHVMIESIEPFTDRQLWVDEISRLEKTEALLFVHGYNVPFAKAARQSAQVAYDLDYEGVPLLYSWPSQGTRLGYLKDEKMVEDSRPFFQEFLNLVSKDTGIETLHVIAHSMGNRLVANALNDRFDSGDQEPIIDQLVLAAPDIDAKEFEDTFAKTLPKLAKRVTLYVSSRDVALKASALVHGRQPRAGHLDGKLLGRIDLNTIDASSASTDFLAHSYFANGESVASDIYCVLKGADTAMRQVLEERAGLSKPAWEILSTGRIDELKRDPSDCTSLVAAPPPAAR